ncbi:MAG: acyl-CoA dehydrogenase family protein [Rhizomicrobium sp.]
MLRLAELDDQGRMLDHHAALAKSFCTAKMRETVAWGRELCGANGIIVDNKVGKFFCDAEALYSYEGTYQMQNLIIGKAVTGFSALHLNFTGEPPWRPPPRSRSTTCSTKRRAPSPR